MSNLIKSWNGRSIRIRPEDRYVCLTDMANATGKAFKHWNENKSTHSYLEALSARVGIPTSELIQVYRGGNVDWQGSWGHPKVALRFAQWCSDEFAVQVDFWIDELLTTGSVNLIDTASRPYFFQRLQMFQERTGRIPDSYFCIFEETLPLVSQLERHGYNIPDDAVIDSSIGRLFCSYMRKEHNLDPDDYCIKYPHWFPGQSRPVPANLYPIEWLIVFRKWLNSRYYNLHLPKYFKGRKDQQALVAVNKFLGLLPGQ